MNKITTLFIIIFCFFSTSLFSQTRSFVQIRQEAKDHVALVIGNSAYPDMPLKNPKNDAEDVAQTFKDMGFIVDKVIDADRETMSMAISKFRQKLTTARVAVFYFAGHGMQVDGENYLIPIGTSPATQITMEEQVPYRAINAGEILIAMEQEQVKFSLIVLDACRNNPIKGGSRSKIKGLASIDAPAGSLVMYSTKAGDVASDGTQRNSPFTKAFLQHIKTPGLDVNLLPSKVTKTVQELTGNTQTPGSYVQLTQSFAFVPDYTLAELEAMKKQQQSQLNTLQIKQAEQKIMQQQEDVEMEKKQAELDALEKQLANMKRQTATGQGDLDEMLAYVEKKEKQKTELEAMKKRIEAERVAREKELAEMKKREFEENLAKYNKIISSEFGADMKDAAWNSMLKNLGLYEGSVPVGNIYRLKEELDLNSFTDPRDGEKYKFVEIGNQVWMAENLCATKYSNGKSISSITGKDAWDNLGSSDKAWCWYENESSNGQKYGVLYTWAAATNGQSSNNNPSRLQGVCPDGWHLPSDTEWEELAKYISIDKGPYSKDDDDWNIVGKHLKATSGWNNSGNGTDDYGFSGLPGGGRSYDGYFSNVGYDGVWWSATEYGTHLAWFRYLDYGNSYLSRDFSGKEVGRSVRCLRD